MGMLRQGIAYTAQEGNPHMHFARARVEALPFANEVFDAALCCGSLHLFTDTVIALREMARTMKPGAILAVFTFTAGCGGILKYRRVREWMHKRDGLHVFKLPEVQQDLTTSGFGDFQPTVSGSVLTFSARKKPV
jgi:ubiquinone/menaquinone biosynthesis C-methylase UbiE